MMTGNATIEIVHGSVTDQDVDVIVNAANTYMRGGGGIDGRIHAAAGPGLIEELTVVAPNGAKTAQPVLTGAHRLPQKHIIHVAGPRWRDGTHGEPRALTACYGNSLAVAAHLGLESIAFCSISTGVYGYPIDDAARVALWTTIKFAEQRPDSPLRRILFALYAADEYQVFNRIMSELVPVG